MFSKISRKYTVHSFKRTERLIEMANFVVLNDNTLRERLRKFGFRPDGPITNTTRDVYVRKLQRLESSSRGAQSNALANATPVQTAIAPMVFRTAVPAQGTVATPSSSIFSSFGRCPALQSNHHESQLTARSAPSGDTSRSSSIVHGKCSSVHYLL